MLAVRSVLPDAPSNHPSIILVHGAANSARVWTYWQEMLAERGYESHAIDLRGHGDSSPVDLSRTSMHDYARDVEAALDKWTDIKSVLIGWSMGGLVSMLAAIGAYPLVRAVVGLAPSTPSLSRDRSIPLRTGIFDAAEYGITDDDPDDQLAMPDLDREERAVALSSLCDESRFARDERAAGIELRGLPCPLLVVTGTADLQWPRSRYDDMPVPAEHMSVEGASHWGLVLNRRALPGIIDHVVSWID